MSYDSDDGKRNVYSNGSISPYGDANPTSNTDSDDRYWTESNGDAKRFSNNGGAKKYIDRTRDGDPQSRGDLKRREKVFQGYMPNTTLEGSLDGMSKHALRPATRYSGGSLRSGFDATVDEVDQHHQSSYMTDGIRQLPRYYPKYQTVMSRDGLGPVYEDTPVSGDDDKELLYSQPQRGSRHRPPNENMVTMSMSDTRPQQKKSLSHSQIVGIVILCIFIVLLALLAIALGVYFGKFSESNTMSTALPSTTQQPPNVILDGSLYLADMPFNYIYKNMSNPTTVNLTSSICNALTGILKPTLGVSLARCIVINYMTGSVISNFQLGFYKPDNVSSTMVQTWATCRITDDAANVNGSLRSSLTLANNVTLTSLYLESTVTISSMNSVITTASNLKVNSTLNVSMNTTSQTTIQSTTTDLANNTNNLFSGNTL